MEQTTMISRDDLMTATEIAKEYGIKRPYVHNLQKRDPKFPKPVILNKAKLYSREEIANWWAAKTTRDPLHQGRLTRIEERLYAAEERIKMLVDKYYNNIGG